MNLSELKQANKILLGKGYTMYQGINVMSAAQIAAKFEGTVVATEEVVVDEAREAELSKLTKAELVALVLKAEAPKVARGTSVQDVARAILTDPELIACTYEEIAGACRLLVPGAQTSSKSIASYVSKKRVEWSLPERIMIRAQKVHAPEVTEVTEEAATTETE